MPLEVSLDQHFQNFFPQDSDSIRLDFKYAHDSLNRGLRSHFIASIYCLEAASSALLKSGEIAFRALFSCSREWLHCNWERGAVILCEGGIDVCKGLILSALSIVACVSCIFFPRHTLSKIYPREHLESIKSPAERLQQQNNQIQSYQLQIQRHLEGMQQLEQKLQTLQRENQENLGRLEREKREEAEKHESLLRQTREELEERLSFFEDEMEEMRIQFTLENEGIQRELEKQKEHYRAIFLQLSKEMQELRVDLSTIESEEQITLKIIPLRTENSVKVILGPEEYDLSQSAAMDAVLNFLNHELTQSQHTSIY